MQLTARTLLGLLTLLTICLVNPAARADAPASRALRRSDVVFMYDNPDLYETYGCTVMGWSGWGNPERVQLAHERGVRLFSTSVGFLTEGRRMIDFSEDFLDAACRDLRGEPFPVPWLWDHEHKGQKFWWWCTNSPLYREYLDMRLKEAMASGADGLHIDDYRGTSGSVTWRAGGFCRHCMAAFREYLAAEVAPNQLAELGIDDLANFDYREFLLEQGLDPADYSARRTSLPLAAEFYDFQVQSNTAFVAQYRARAEELAGRAIHLSVNSGLSNPHALAIAPHLSYFCCEVGHAAASRQPPTAPVTIYKLGDGLDRPVAATASGHDWAFVKEHQLSGLVRTWIAMSYAFGHQLMAPHRQWCYTQERGTHWYSGPTEEYAWLYQFVRQNQDRLDGYQAIAPIGLLYDNAARRAGAGSIDPIAQQLAARNLPFTIVVAGDNWLDVRLDPQQLEEFQALIVTEPLKLDAEQRAALQPLKEQDRLVVGPDAERLEDLVGRPVQVEGAEQVWVVPRARRDDSAPPVIHLLNRAYDAETDQMLPQSEFILRLDPALFVSTPTRAVLHAPQAEPLELEVRTNGGHLELTVPSLDLWAILAFSR